MQYRKHILVIRLSALGDVAILQPVLKSRALANPDVLFSLAIPGLLAPLFAGIDNLNIIPTKKKQSFIRLFRSLYRIRPSHVADMHSINRTILADFLFILHGVPVAAIKKHTRKIIPSWKRYDLVFDRCGLNRCELDLKPITAPVSSGTFSVGIAPFAQHKGKIWPLEYTEQLVSRLSQWENVSIFLFGSKSESSILEAWESYPNVVSLAGKMSFEEEMEHVSNLSVMVSMDSANMHFASVYGIPVVSIWGATHPNRGFYGWRQDLTWCVQANLPCRPCSKYGNKPCQYEDYRCLHAVKVDEVLNKIELIRNSQSI